MAQRLISRKRLPEALDLLNETIGQDPRLAATFETRAIAFEAMGMLPQAEADRLKAASLRAAQTPVTPPPPPPPPPEPPVTPTPAASPPEPEDAALAAALLSDKASEGDAVAAAESAAEEEDASDPVEEAAAASDAGAAPPDEPPPPVLPAYQPPPRSFGSGLLRAAGVVFFALAVFLIAGLGIYFALNEVGGSSDDGTSAPTASPASSETEPGGDGSGASGASGDDSDVPPTVDEALTGSPYSFSHLEDAWHAQALAVSIGEISETVTGFAEPGVDITLTGNGEVMELSVLIYPSTEAKDADWTIGAAPAPKADGTVPAGSSIWYNANTIVVVRVSAPALRQDALDGFLSLGGTPPQESPPQESPTEESLTEESPAEE